MKKLIILLTMLLSINTFAQDYGDLHLKYRDTKFAEAGGNLYTSLSAGLYESSGLALKVSLPPPYTLTQTGAQLQTILDGTYDSLITHRERSWVADDGEIVLATGVAGFGQAMIGDNQEWAHFRFTSAGAVTLIANSGNVVNTDTDTNLCIYDAGSGIAIKNRLGSALTVMIDIDYADPTP